MNSIYDIVIIGGGPAGLLAARTLMVDTNLTLCIVEKSIDYAKSIVCGEGVWSGPFDRLLPDNKRWVKYSVTTADFRAPNGTSVLLQNSGKTMGYIIDRPQMQENLLQEIAEFQTVLRGKRVVALSQHDTKHRVTFDDGAIITASLVLDASGPASKLGESYGLSSSPKELEPAGYALVKNVQQDVNSIILQMSSRFGPGGYFWSFPHSETIANVGMVLGKDHTKSVKLRERVQEAIELIYPEGEIISWHGGAIPNYVEPRRLTADGYLQCGDSAELVNSISRSGISESMQSGVWAAEAAREMLKATTSTERVKVGQSYEKRLYKSYGRAQHKVAKVKKSLYTAISDEQFNAAATALNKKPFEKRTMWQILRVTCWRAPRLLLALRHLL